MAFTTTTVEHSINMLGMKIKGRSAWIYLLFPIIFVVGYIISAVVLYAFNHLFGFPEFTWFNTLCWMIVAASAKYVFSGDNA